MATLISRLKCGARDRDLWAIAALFWLASLVRVVLGLVHGEVFGVDASLALCCVFLVPWAFLPRKQRRPDSGIHSSRPGPVARGVVTAVVTLVSVVVLFVMWGRSRDTEQTAIRHLPHPERRALYERTLTTLESSCDSGSRPRGLDWFCDGQAALIAQFPECDAPCQALAKRHRAPPSR